MTRPAKHRHSFVLAGQRFELTDRDVANAVEGRNPDPIRRHWVEVDGRRWPPKQVLALATGLGTWEFQSQSSTRLLARLGFTLGSNEGLVSAALPSASQRPTTLASAASRPPMRSVGPADVVLISCVRRKLDRAAPAKELYTSPYFRKMCAYAEASGVPWFILSALHGTLSPDQAVEPYNLHLASTSSDYRRKWGERATRQVTTLFGSLSGIIVELHAGAAYVDAISPHLERAGATVSLPLHGLRHGERLAWYNANPFHRPAPADGREPVDDLSDHVELEAVIGALTDTAKAISPSAFRDSRGPRLNRPGLYTWWIDESGAAMLSAGLGLPLMPGLVYAGQAGAARASRDSNNTLWGRIGTMHLGRNRSFSTLRLSLAAVLSAGHAHSISEDDLTTWMQTHLRVIALPIADRGTVAALEPPLLEALNPPLNLRDVDRTTPLRRRLTQLRSAHLK